MNSATLLTLIDNAEAAIIRLDEEMQTPDDCGMVDDGRPVRIPRTHAALKRAIKRNNIKRDKHFALLKAQLLDMRRHIRHIRHMRQRIIDAQIETPEVIDAQN